MSKNLNSHRGEAILIIVYLIIAVLLTVSAIFISRTINEKNNVTRHRNIALAFHLAESGLDAGLNWLRNQPVPPAQLGQLNLGTLNGPQSLGSGTYTTRIDADINNGPGNPMRYRITSTGAAVGDINQTLFNEVQTDTYARYAYFTDTEHFRCWGFRIPVWFIGGDTIEGPTQSNTHFHMRSNPVFNGPIKSADNYTTFFNNGSPIDTPALSNPPIDVPVFQQGLDLAAEPIDMPSKALDLRTAAVQGGLQLTGPTTVVLNADETMSITNSGNTWIQGLPNNGTLFVEGGDLTVSGTLNGKLTMGTNRNIIVSNNITYANNPQIDPASDDVLGLIAERDVVISQNAPYDLEVDASIMALGNSFVVENWWQGPAKGTLTTYGGVIQKERGPVGTFNPATGQRASGYAKDYNYDPRLLNLSPPFYPNTGDYISLSWSE